MRPGKGRRSSWRGTRRAPASGPRPAPSPSQRMARLCPTPPTCASSSRGSARRPDPASHPGRTPNVPCLARPVRFSTLSLTVRTPHPAAALTVPSRFPDQREALLGGRWTRRNRRVTVVAGSGEELFPAPRGYASSVTGATLLPGHSACPGSERLPTKGAPAGTVITDRGPQNGVSPRAGRAASRAGAHTYLIHEAPFFSQT